jgi:hypothetical protein
LEIIEIAVKLVAVSNSPFVSYRKLYTQKALVELKLAKQASYYFIDQNDRIYQAKKSTLPKLFGGHKKAIELYEETNQMDFTFEQDLTKLLTFCSRWSKK